MDDSTRGGSTYAGDEVDEFDLLLADDDDELEPPAGRSGLTGRIRAIQPPAVDGGTAARPRRTRGAGADAGAGSRLRIAPDWSRIAAVLFVAAVVLFIVGFAVSSFMGHRKQGAFDTYFGDVRDVMTQSTAQGEELQSILDEPTGGDRAQRVARLEQLAERSHALVVEARKLEVPEAMAPAHEWMVTTLEYRERAIDQLQTSLTTALTAKKSETAAAAVADALARALASDVIWVDSYSTEAKHVLDVEGIEGVSVPQSEYLRNHDIVGPEAAAQMLDRLKSSQAVDPKTKKVAVPNDGKTRGGELQATQVVVAPSGTALMTDGLTKIQGGDDVEFEVPFTNQGDVQLSGVPVTITIRGDNSDPIELVGEIDTVDPGETATAKVSLDEVPTFGEILTMSIEVGPVPGEKTVENNKATYEVQFSL